MLLGKRFGCFAAALLLTSVTSLSAAGQSAENTSARKLTIDRLYSLPWVIGTRPEDPAWSPDSRRLAFLWNDEGTNFHDVWLTGIDTGKPVRVTTMPRPESPKDAESDITKLQQVERAETDRGVSSVIWGPEGRYLIFEFHGQLYRVVPGETPRLLFDAKIAPESAALAPHGHQLAYISGGALWVADPAVGQGSARSVYAPQKTAVSVEEFHWSTDGARLAFVEADASRVPLRGIPDYLGEETRLVSVRRPFPGEPSEARRLGVISATGGEVRWAELKGDPLDTIFGVRWSPDSGSLLVDKSDLYIKDRQLLLVDPSTGLSKVLVREVDPKNVTAEWWSDWAPDGRGVYFTSDRDNDYHVYTKTLTPGEPRAVTKGDWAVFSAAVSPDAHSIFLVSNQGRREERQLFRVPLAGGIPQRLTQEAGTHTPTVSPDGEYVADIFSSDSKPADLYLVRTHPSPTDGLVPVRVTHSPLPEFYQYRWVAAQYVEFPNVNDGTTLHARLTLPPHFDRTRRYPAILGSVYSNTVHNQWGGRIFHPTWGLDQFLAQQGYVIMNVDIRGSSGYGKTFRQGIGQDYGGIDVDDLYSGVKYLVSQGFVDEHRVGIWGSSYGGLLTAMSLFTHPGVYQAGVAGAPATSLFHAQTGEMRTMMAPQDHMQQYERSSAFLRSGGLKDHLMILHGMRDDTVLFKDSITLEERLILQGKDITLTVLPNAPHGWDTEGLAQTRFAYHQMVDYFDRYLQEKPTAQTGHAKGDPSHN